MKFLSVIQPYATLIALGIKHIENRRFQTDYRGWIAIQASKKHDLDFWDGARRQCRRAGVKFPENADFSYGGVVGIAKLTGIVYLNTDDEPDGENAGYKKEWLTFWNRDWYGWILEKQSTTPFIPMKGALGLRDLPDDIYEIIRKQNRLK